MYSGFHQRAISQEMFINVILNLCSEITLLELQLQKLYRGHWVNVKCTSSNPYLISVYDINQQREPCALFLGCTPHRCGWAVSVYIGRAYWQQILIFIYTPIARLMGPTWGPSGAHRKQVGPMLAPWTLLSGIITHSLRTINIVSRTYSHKHAHTLTPNKCI